MPWFVKIDDPEDFAWLKEFLESWERKSQANVAAYVEHIEKFQRLADSFREAKLAESVQVVRAASVEAPKTVRRKRGEAKAERPNLCSEHPTYGAKKRPRTDCPTCWLAYEKYNGKPAADLAKRKFNRSRSTT